MVSKHDNWFDPIFHIITDGDKILIDNYAILMRYACVKMITSSTEDLVYHIQIHWFKNLVNIIVHQSLVAYDFNSSIRLICVVNMT